MRPSGRRERNDARRWWTPVDSEINDAARKASGRPDKNREDRKLECVQVVRLWAIKSDVLIPCPTYTRFREMPQ